MSWGELMDLLSHEFNRKAILAALLIGFANGYLSGFIVLRKSALMVSSLSHSLLPGLALAAVIFGALNPMTGFFGALGAALIVGLGAIAISRHSRIDGNSALAILYTTGFGAGLVLLQQSSVRSELQHWLFGNILGLADSDLWVAWGISGVVLMTLTVLQRPLLLVLFEPSIAASLGIRVRLLDYVLMALTVLSLVNSLQAVGCVLSIGLMVAPAATVYLFANSPRLLFWGGAFLGAGVSVTAVILSNVIPNLPTGAAIVVLLGGVFLIALVVRLVISKAHFEDGPTLAAE